jgi:formiminotetrahydrofolate cyclodeaminase
MQTEPDVRHVTVLEALEAIGSAQPSSGAGIAAAISLALATACALKAVNISLKHTDDPALRACAERLQLHRHLALDRAEVDARVFGRYLQDREPRDAALLVKAAEDFQALAREIADELKGLEARVQASVAADVSAAQSLHAAAVAIEALIMRDSRELRARTMP